MLFSTTWPYLLKHRQTSWLLDLGKLNPIIVHYQTLNTNASCLSFQTQSPPASASGLSRTKDCVSPSTYWRLLSIADKILRKYIHLSFFPKDRVSKLYSPGSPQTCIPHIWNSSELKPQDGQGCLAISNICTYHGRGSHIVIHLREDSRREGLCSLSMNMPAFLLVHSYQNE